MDYYLTQKVFYRIVEANVFVVGLAKNKYGARSKITDNKESNFLIKF